MCGLVGIAGDTSGGWRDLFAELLLYDVVRGPHSTGAGFVDRFSNSFDLIKRVGHPFNLFESKEYDQAMLAKNSYKVILGHNRFATFGEKTEANAHPFAFKNVIGMHNGTLDKFCVRDLYNAADYGTDSEAIFATINKLGIEEALKVMSGAWALVWFDKHGDKLNMLNNGRRPLHYCYSEDMTSIIWASELDMLKYAMKRRNKKSHNDAFFYCEKDIHYEWDVPKFSTNKFQAPKQTKREGRSYTTYGVYSSFKGGAKHSTGGTTSTATQSTRSDIIQYADRSKTNKFRPPYKDLYGKIINKPQFCKLVEEGCCFCGVTEQKWGSFVYLMSAYTDHRTPYVCESCFNDEEVYPYTQYAM